MASVLTRLLRNAILPALILAVSAATGARVACAAGSTPGAAGMTGASGPLRWADTTRYDDCDQACILEKANENISLQITAIEQKIHLLDEKVRANRNDSTVTDELEGYCLSSESAAKCVDRYKSFESLMLEKLQAALVRNEDARARLMSKRAYVGLGRIDGDDRSRIEHGVDPNAAPRLAQAPYVPTFDELKSEYEQESVTLRALTSEQYREWLRNYPTQPSLDDFVVTKQIYRNPDNPLEGTITIIDTDGQGHIKHDQAAYQAAMQAFQRRATQLQQDIPQLRMGSIRSRANLGLDVVAGADSHRAYDRGRAQLVQTANQVLRANNPAAAIRPVSTESFGGGQPASASGGPRPASTESQSGVVRAGTSASEDPSNPNEQVVEVRHPAGDHDIQTTTVSVQPDTVSNEINQIELSVPEP